mmetsp:Transcript_105357/g.198398  ORF Transcript_105357/g.198398 Transcript_105357/m.198398 type:complete len:330 (-) Transcript_105357:54-1043(-)
MGRDQAAQKAAYVKDPLLSRSTKVYATAKVSDRARTARSTYRVTSIVVVSFLCYLAVVFFYFGLFSSRPGVVVTFTLLILCLCAAQPVFIEVFFPSQPWRAWIGKLGMFSVVAAILVGLFVHYKWMVYYVHYKEMPTHTNVAPSENSMQYEDAGGIIFSADTVVDVQRSVGYRDANTSTTLCVAPVVDGTMALEDPVGFFAVGTGCCGWRGSFTCDDVAESDAKSGMLLLTPKTLVSPLMSWTVEGAVDFEAYDAAIKLESAVFGTTVAKHIRLLHWKKDMDESLKTYKKNALSFVWISCALQFITLIILAYIVIEQPFNSEAQKSAVV